MAKTAKKTKFKPQFNPSRLERDMVEILASGRMSEERIALALGVDPKTLRKHCAGELSAGMARRDAEMLKAQFDAGVKGNASAQKVWLARADLLPQSDQPPTQKEEAFGKKQQELIEAAKGAEGTPWADIIQPPSTTTTQ